MRLLSFNAPLKIRILVVVDTVMILMIIGGLQIVKGSSEIFVTMLNAFLQQPLKYVDHCGGQTSRDCGGSRLICISQSPVNNA
jgi:hypothetical protein